MILTFHSVNC